MSKKLPFVQSVALYKYGQQVLIVPNGRLRMGLGVGMAILATAPVTVPHEIGSETLRLLKLCEDNLPDELAQSFAPSVALILKHIKLKSWRRFHQTSVQVDAVLRPGSKKIEVTPWKKNGRYSEPLIEKQRLCRLAPEEIGLVVLQSFGDAE